MAFNPDDLSRFEPFSILTTTYKTVDSHNISLNVLFPQTLKQSSSEGSPIIIRFHGGGLVAGASLFPDFFGKWLLETSERYSAIIISANHRLMPESNADDIMEDIEDVWKWIHASLPAYLEQQTGGRIKPNLSRIMTAGESAGGYLSVQLSLNHPDHIRATTAQYPMLDMRSPHFMEAYQKQLFVFPQFPESLVRDHVANIKAQESSSGKRVLISEDGRLSRVTLMAAMVQHGLFKEYFGSDAKLYPIERIERGEKLPRGGIFIWHGTEDSIVPIDGSKKFVAALKKAQPDYYCKFEQKPGEHGFDHDTKIDEEWVAEGMAPLLKEWLR